MRAIQSRFVQEDPRTREIIGAAAAVHRELGPGLLESTYHACLRFEFTSRGLPFESEVAVPVVDRGVTLDCGYRIDRLVGGRVMVELKSVEKLLPVHEAQLLTYMRLASKRVGLLFNFNSTYLREGMLRRVL